MICWKMNLISTFFVSFWVIILAYKSINVAGVFQEAGDADSMAETRSQV